MSAETKYMNNNFLQNEYIFFLPIKGYEKMKHSYQIYGNYMYEKYKYKFHQHYEVLSRKVIFDCIPIFSDCCHQIVFNYSLR